MCDSHMVDYEMLVMILINSCDFAVYLVPPSAEPAVSVNGSPARTAEGCACRSRSGTDTLPSSVSEPVQTQQPCSLKASMSSDNVCSGLQGEGAGVYSHPGQGELPYNNNI